MEIAPEKSFIWIFYTSQKVNTSCPSGMIFSGKTEIFLLPEATGKNVANCLEWFFARYGMLKGTTLVTDGGSHFAIAIVANLVKTLNIRHHVCGGVFSLGEWSGREDQPRDSKIASNLELQ